MPRSPRVVEFTMALGFGILLAEGHGAEADRANLDAGPAKLAIVHQASC